MLFRNRWRVAAAGAFLLTGVLAAGIAGYWRHVNQLPAYPFTRGALPVPNGYTDFLTAGLMCQAAGGAKVLWLVPPAERDHPLRGSGRFGTPIRLAGVDGRLALPILRNNQPVFACEPDVPLDQVRAVVT